MTNGLPLPWTDPAPERKKGFCPAWRNCQNGNEGRGRDWSCQFAHRNGENLWECSNFEQIEYVKLQDMKPTADLFEDA